MRNLLDPLTFIPSPEAVRRNLNQAEQLVERLRILLQVSEQIHPRDDRPAAERPVGGVRA